MFPHPTDVPCGGRKVIVTPDVKCVPVAPGDWIVLGCDGIFDALRPAELAELVHALGGAAWDGDVGALAAGIVRRCLGSCAGGLGHGERSSSPLLLSIQ